MVYCSERSNPLLLRNRLKRKRFAADANQKTIATSAMSWKICERLSPIAGTFASHGMGSPPRFSPSTTKPRNATSPTLAVRMAIRFLSSPRRLSWRRMNPLCKNEEKSSPATKNTVKAAMPAGEICRPKRLKTGAKNH
jgi:hypothetical protein